MAMLRIGRNGTGTDAPDDGYEQTRYDEDYSDAPARSKRGFTPREAVDPSYHGRFASYDNDVDDGYADGYEDDYAPSDRYDDDYADEDEGYYEDDSYGSRYGEYQEDDDGYQDSEYGDGYGDGYYEDDYQEYEEPARGGLMGYIDTHDWVMYVLLFLCPPLGIWLLWRSGRFEKPIQIAITAVSALWFVILIVLIVLLIRGRSAQDVQTYAPTPTQAPIAVVDASAPTPTAEPTTEPTEAPTPTPVPLGTQATAAPGSLVWSSSTGTFYHATDTCTGIAADEQVTRVTLENAKNRGKYACPVCYTLEQFYMNDENQYYHKDQSCSGLALTTEVTAEQAQAAGKSACPVCVTKVTDKLIPVVEGSTVFVDISTQDQSNLKVWFTENGENYHRTADCRGMQGAHEATLKEALLAGKTACSTCCAAGGNLVYCTRNGTYYHRIDNCSGMSGASTVTLAEALVLGKQACPECMPKNSGALVGTHFSVSNIAVSDESNAETKIAGPVRQTAY